MFDSFLNGGSPLAVALMVYVQSVMIEVLRFQHIDGQGFNGPRAFYTPIGTIVPLLAMPCAIWPAVYVGLFDGIFAGIIAWLVLQFASAIMVQVFKIRSALIGFHFIFASVAMLGGYYLSIVANPAWS